MNSVVYPLHLVQLGHLMPESLHFDEMCDDEVRLLQLRHCLVWECGVSPSFDDHSDYRPGALQRVQLDFETDGRIRFGPLASIGPSTDLIRYLLPFLDIRSHFLFAACSKMASSPPYSRAHSHRRQSLASKTAACSISPSPPIQRDSLPSIWTRTHHCLCLRCTIDA